MFFFISLICNCVSVLFRIEIRSSQQKCVSNNVNISGFQSIHTNKQAERPTPSKHIAYTCGSNTRHTAHIYVCSRCMLLARVVLFSLSLFPPSVDSSTLFQMFQFSFHCAPAHCFIIFSGESVCFCMRIERALVDVMSYIYIHTIII